MKSLVIIFTLALFSLQVEAKEQMFETDNTQSNKTITKVSSDNNEGLYAKYNNGVKQKADTQHPKNHNKYKHYQLDRQTNFDRRNGHGYYFNYTNWRIRRGIARK